MVNTDLPSVLCIAFHANTRNGIVNISAGSVFNVLECILVTRNDHSVSTVYGTTGVTKINHTVAIVGTCEQVRGQSIVINYGDCTALNCPSVFTTTDDVGSIAIGGIQNQRDTNNAVTVVLVV